MTGRDKCSHDYNRELRSKQRGFEKLLDGDQMCLIHACDHLPFAAEHKF